MLTKDLQIKMQQLQAQGLLRERIAIEARYQQKIKLRNKSFVNFASNDYLCLATHPKVKRAFLRGIEKYGLGSGASALVSGFYNIHKQLEEKFADFLQRDCALLFNSGYMANLGVITTFANRHSVIVADKLCHASLIDGIQLSRAKHYRYQHNDVSHAELFLKNTHKKTILVSESVFSMQGDIAPLHKLSSLTRRYKALLIVDDAHGVGVLGKDGSGICKLYQLNQNDVPLLITPLGKAFGSIGAVISGPKTFIEQIQQSARSYHYTTALPPSIAQATLAALHILQKATGRRNKLTDLIHFFIEQAKLKALPLMSTDYTPIKSILIGDNEKTLKMQQLLLKNGFFTACIRPPTVPCDTARIRISINCKHTIKDIKHLIHLMAQFYDDHITT